MHGGLIQQLRMDKVSHNLANVDTIGFKEDRLHQLFAVPDLVKGPSPGGFERTLAVSPVASYTHFDQGALTATGNPLDMAIEGPGFFVVQTPQGPRYTRQGDFSLNEQGVLITQSGHPVMGQGGEITLDDDAFTLDGDNGRHNLFVDGLGNLSVGADQIGTLRIVEFENLQGLKKAGDGLFQSVGAGERPAAETTQVAQGMLEGSNVTVVEMMAEMIEALRGYQSYQKAIQAQDDADSLAINDVGGQG
jgi:flagellar basal-body rod protein FlgG